MSGIGTGPIRIAAGQRVRYIEILGPAPGGWKVKYTCCGTVHHRTDVQIRRVRINLANQCDRCRLAAEKQKSIIKRRPSC